METTYLKSKICLETGLKSFSVARYFGQFVFQILTFPTVHMYAP